MSVDKIKEELKTRWGDEPTVAICFAIIDFMTKVPPDQLQMLTFASLKSAANKDEIDSELLKAITILASSKVAALDAHAMLVDDDEREHEISIEYLSTARASGEFIHPETGRVVEDFESKIFPFFVPSANFTSAES
jgi:hypothetical protein